MLKNVCVFKDVPDDFDLDSIHTLSFVFDAAGIESKQYIFVTEEDVSEKELADNLRAFADMVEFGIEGEFH